MCSTSSAALADLPLGSSDPVCTRQPSAKQNHIADTSLAGTGLESPSTMMSEPSLPTAFGQMVFPLMPSPAASPAKISAMQDLERVWLEKEAAYSSNMPDLLASWDQTSLSWRTSQRCLIEGWEPFSERFPTSGTMQSGTLSPHAPWDSHICDAECSLWPTPTASMDGRGFGIPLHENTGRYKRSTVSRVHALVKEHGWRIHPRFTEALMGFPTGWSEIEPLETPLPRTSRKRSGGQS